MEERVVGVGPWPGGSQGWPRDAEGRVSAPYDPALLEAGDTRNVADHEKVVERLRSGENIGKVVMTFTG